MHDAHPASEPVYDVAIVGAGFSGSLTAVHLLDEAERVVKPWRVALIEKEPNAFGRGVAYSTPCARHLLNVPVGKMGAFPDRPEHFLDWLRVHPAETAALGLGEIGADAFVPRVLYGRYVADLLHEAEVAAGTRFRRIVGEVVEISDPTAGTDGRCRIELADGAALRAERVVLALGTFPPGDPRLRDTRFHRSPRYLYSPWSAETHERLAGPGDVLILGSGLTGLDLLLTLQDRKREGVLHVLSRHGLFPQPHRSGLAVWPAFLHADHLPRTAREALRVVRREIARAAAAGVDWRSVVDSLRPFTQRYWRGLVKTERRRFLRHLRSLWEPHRHRAAPEALAAKDRLERAGRLVSHCGRITRIAEVDGGSALEVTYQPRCTKRSAQTLRVSYVVNCTGPECNYHQLNDPLIANLFARGLARPDALMLGLDVGEDGEVYDADGSPQNWIFTLGSPQKGRLLETTAVPELRVQARDLAARLRRSDPGVAATAARVPERALAFEI